jgi:hypothetical protein
MDWAPSVDLPDEEMASQYDVVILFLDEMNSAPPAVQAAGYQLVLDRKIGNYELPDNVVIVAAGNRESDKGVTYRMPSPLSNRFIHFEMRVDHGDWEEWAVGKQLNADVIGYLAQHKSDLMDFNPRANTHAFATPRSWEFVSDVLNNSRGLNDTQINDVITGTVGEGIALKFNGHRKFAGQLPTTMEVLEGRVTTLKVKEISAHYALMVNLCYQLKELRDKITDNDKKKLEEWHAYFDNMLTFIMENFGTELIIMGMRAAAVTYKLKIEFKKLKNWNKFHNQYGKYVMNSVTN